MANTTEIKEIKGRDVLKIQGLPGEFEYKVEKTSPMFGKKYRRFAFLGKVFVANVEDSFCKEFDSGKLYSVNVEINSEDQLSFVGKTNIDQEVNMAKAEATLLRIEASATLVGLTAEQIAQLEEETP
jgi:hypothetical protein